jgi:hypothetical protein
MGRMSGKGLETRHCVADTHPNGLRFFIASRDSALERHPTPRSGPLTLRAGRDGRLGYRGVSRDSFRRALRVAHLDPLGAAAVSGAARTVAVSLPPRARCGRAVVGRLFLHRRAGSPAAAPQRDGRCSGSASGARSSPVGCRPGDCGSPSRFGSLFSLQSIHDRGGHHADTNDDRTWRNPRTSASGHADGRSAVGSRIARASDRLC